MISTLILKKILYLEPHGVFPIEHENQKCKEALGFMETFMKRYENLNIHNQNLQLQIQTLQDQNQNFENKNTNLERLVGTAKATVEIEGDELIISWSVKVEH